MYTMYCNGHEAAAMQVNDLSTSSETVAEFLRNAGTKEAIGGGGVQRGSRRGGVSSSGKSVDIQSLLIAPVQRVPRYMLLLRELLKFTPETRQPAHDQLVAALDKVKATATHINDHIKKKEDMLRVWQIQQFFFPLSQRVIMKPTRLFIRQGVLIKIGRSAGTRKRYTVFLFSDLLVYASKMSVGKGYWVERPDKTLRAVQPLGVTTIKSSPDRHSRSSSMNDVGGDSGGQKRRPSMMKSIFSRGSSSSVPGKDEGDVSSDEEEGGSGEIVEGAVQGGAEGGLIFEVDGGKREKKLLFEAETQQERDEWASDIAIVRDHVRRVREQAKANQAKGSGQTGSRTMRLGANRPGWFGNKRKGKDGKEGEEEAVEPGGTARSQTPPAAMKTDPNVGGNRDRCHTAPTGSLIDMDGWEGGADEGGDEEGRAAAPTTSTRGSDLISFDSQAGSDAPYPPSSPPTSLSPATDIYSTVQAPLGSSTSPTAGTIGETSAGISLNVGAGISDKRQLQRQLSPASNFREQQLRQLLGPPPPPTAGFSPSTPSSPKEIETWQEQARREAMAGGRTSANRKQALQEDESLLSHRRTQTQ
jgi:hypothetical protein